MSGLRGYKAESLLCLSRRRVDNDLGGLQFAEPCDACKYSLLKGQQREG